MEGGVSSCCGPECFSPDCLGSSISLLPASLKAQARTLASSELMLCFGDEGFEPPTTSELSRILHQVAPFPPLFSVSAKKNVLQCLPRWHQGQNNPENNKCDVPV